VLIVHHVFRPDDSRQALEVGTLMPAHATALGKALLAHHRYIAAELGDDALVGYTAATVTDVSRFRQELETVAQRGWASEIGELFHGSASIAAPIEDRRQVTVGSIGIAGPIERLCDDGRPRPELVDYVMEAARAVSRELGAIPW
jgi:DNA-binding IclR family transcriptional regulator